MWLFGIGLLHFIFIYMYVPFFLFLFSLLFVPSSPFFPFSATHLLLLIFFDTSSPFSSGKFIVEGQMLRAKAQLDHLQSNIASAARKTGISSATKLALLGPSREGREEDIPLVEWWDAAILPNRR